MRGVPRGGGGSRLVLFCFRDAVRVGPLGEAHRTSGWSNMPKGREQQQNSDADGVMVCICCACGWRWWKELTPKNQGGYSSSSDRILEVATVGSITSPHPLGSSPDTFY